MQEDLLKVLESYTVKNRLRRVWRKLVRIMACFVVFCTTYALILPAITQESALYCGIAEHTHTDACYVQGTGGEEPTLGCGLEAHAHTLICHSDPQTDLETRENWEQSIAFAQLTGVWKEDIVSIARTQRGYVESTRNYMVLEDGTMKGCTRYGAWYADPYGDWAAMFASFCLSHAGVEDMPLESDVSRWIRALSAPEPDLYRSRENHIPGSGELVFFDMDSDASADHVGIITDVISAEDGTAAQIATIEGDVTNRVQELRYSLDDARIVGYSRLPVQLSAAEQSAVALVIAKIEALPAPDRTEEAHIRQVAEAYHRYAELNEAQKKKVTNADKLMALEFIWSVAEYTPYENIHSEPVATVPSAHTSDLVELNIYDYSGLYSPEMENDVPGPDAFFGEDQKDGLGGKKNTASIDGLFQQDPVSGEYFYNSRWNHAQYDEVASAFTLYHQTVTADFVAYPFGNFLPFHDITDADNTVQVQAFNYRGGVRDYIQQNLKDLEDCNTASQGADQSVIEQIQMLQGYKAAWENDEKWEQLTAAEALNGAADEKQPELAERLKELYNIDYDVGKNFFFGMDMKLTFMQAPGGFTGADNGSNVRGIWEKARDKNGDSLSADDDTMILTGGQDGIPDYPMVFSFTGGDDVWVYVDGIRFLDLSGSQYNGGGRIDFEKGIVCYARCEGAAEDAYETQTFRDLLTQYGGIAEEDLGKYLKQDESGAYTTFHDYSTHTLRFCYLERGGGSSVFDLRFNFPLLQKNTLTVTSEMDDSDAETRDTTVLGDPDHYFQIVTTDHERFVGPDSVTGVSQYRIQDSSGNMLKNADGTDKLFAADAWGIFTLKAGQTAIFEGIEACSEQIFLRELIPAEDMGRYCAVYMNNRETGENMPVDWSAESRFSPEEQPYGLRWYCRSGPVMDVSAADALVFKQSGRVDADRLGSLRITQTLIGAETDRSFDVTVTLDGVQLPVGTAYTVGGEVRTVAEPGIVILGSGETAVIGNILAGSRFAVSGTDAQPYTVAYDWDESSAEDVQAQNDSVIGVVHTDGDAAVTVINAEHGAQVEIPVYAAIANPDGQEHTCVFVLEQVTDSTGQTPVQDGTVMEQTMVLTDEPVSFTFTLPYLMTQMETLPATFYYRITEEAGADRLDNTQQFVATILVEEAEDGLRASLTDINGSAELSAAEFRSTLAGSLILTNCVNGDDAHRAQIFDFTLELTAPENVALPAQLQAVRTAADGTQTMLTLQPENGVVRIEGLADGEAVAVTGIPAGTGWSLSQSYAYEFITSTRMGGVTSEGRGAAGAIVTGSTAVEFINTQTYALPKTGGAGTYQYAMAGWMLLLCSFACLLYNPAKRRKGDRKTP